MKAEAHVTDARSDSERELLLASLRHVLARVAWWTTFLFDEGAHVRLAKLKEGFAAGELPTFTVPGSAGEYSERSPLFSLIGRAHDMAIAGAWNGSVEQLNTAARTLKPLYGLLKTREALCGPYDDPLLDDEAVERLLAVIDNLMWRRELMHGRPISLPGIAALSGLAEKTVRMAAKKTPTTKKAIRQDDPALYTIKEKSRTWVRAEETTRWLRLRPHYKSTSCTDTMINIQPRTSLELATMLSDLRAVSKLTIKDLMHRLGLPARAVPSYEKLEEGWWDALDVDLDLFDARTLIGMARLFKIEQVLLFVQAVQNVLAPFNIARDSAKARKVVQ